MSGRVIVITSGKGGDSGDNHSQQKGKQRPILLGDFELAFFGCG